MYRFWLVALNKEENAVPVYPILIILKPTVRAQLFASYHASLEGERVEIRVLGRHTAAQSNYSIHSRVSEYVHWKECNNVF
jgi:hypothetical protein